MALLTALMPCFAEQSRPSAPPPTDQAAAATETATLSNAEASYLYGVEFGGQLRDLGIGDRLSVDALMQGLQKGLDGSAVTGVGEVQRANLFLGWLRDPKSAENATIPVPTIDEGSYLYGANFGMVLHKSGVADQMIHDAIARGMQEGMSGKRSLTNEDYTRMRTYAMVVNENAANERRAAVRAFMEKNKGEKGVITTPSGLQYKVIAAGDRKGPSPKSADRVKVQYRGALVNGTEFDSSYARGAPVVLPVNGVIKGWQEALVMMKPGAKWRLFVSPELGYGYAPFGKIPGGSVLVFDLELLAVDAPQQGSAASTVPAG